MSFFRSVIALKSLRDRIHAFFLPRLLSPQAIALFTQIVIRSISSSVISSPVRS